MIKHLKPFSEEHIEYVRSHRTPEEAISEFIDEEIRSYMQKLVFETNVEERRKMVADYFNSLNEKVKFSDITTPNDVDNGTARFQGSMKMNNDDTKIFSIGITKRQWNSEI